MKNEKTNYKLKRFKKRLFDIIQIGNKEDFPSHFFDIFISIVIISNIAVMILETFDQLSSIYPYLHYIEVITMWIFIVEYLLRIWTANLLYPEKSYGRAIGKFLISYDGIIDLLTILPFFLFSGFVVFRMLRVVRIFHLFRINSQYDSFNVITTVLYQKKNQIISSVFILLILMIGTSLGMYSVEHTAQPEVFQNAFSGMWWSVSAMLTVGYGDIYPITILGKILAIITALLGVGVVAIPTGIISAGFVEQYTIMKNQSYAEDDNAVDFISIKITSDHTWLGNTIGEAIPPAGLRISLILRQDQPIVPRAEMRFAEGDVVILSATAQSL